MPNMTCAICRGDFNGLLRTHCPYCGAIYVKMGHGKTFCDYVELENNRKFIGVERATGAVSQGQYPYRAPNYVTVDACAD